MAEFVTPEHPLLSEDERAELQAVFSRFVAAVKSPDEDGVTTFLASEEEFFESASPLQNAIFAMAMQRARYISEDESYAALNGDAYSSAYIEVDDLEMSDLGIEVSHEHLSDNVDDL